MEVVNDLLNYNNMKIYQNDDWFLFSLDSVLLANFVTITHRTKKIIDFGTGNAPIPLFLSTRTEAEILGVEIQSDLAILAEKSVDINNLNKQIKIININIKKIVDYYDSDTFDVVVSNPPYFKAKDTSIYNEDIHKKIARHEVEITLNDIIKQSAYLLKNNGNLALVHRTDRLIEIINLLLQNNLMPKRLRFVYPKEGRDSNLVLIEATKNGHIGLKILPPLYVHNSDNTYTKEITKIFEGDK